MDWKKYVLMSWLTIVSYKMNGTKFPIRNPEPHVMLLFFTYRIGATVVPTSKFILCYSQTTAPEPNLIAPYNAQ